MTRNEKLELLCRLMNEAQRKSGVTQKMIAKRIGKAERTVQSWLLGDTVPRLDDVEDFFTALGMNPTPYELRYFHPEMGDGYVDAEEPGKALLHKLVDMLDEPSALCLAWCLSGENGSNPRGEVMMWTANASLPLADRRATCANILLHHSNAEAAGTLLDCPEVDIAHIQACLDASYQAIKSRSNVGYSVGGETNGTKAKE